MSFAGPSNFSRAASPATAASQAIANAMSFAVAEDATVLQRQSVLMGASSFDDVIACIPQGYRETLRPELAKAATAVAKRDAARLSLAKLESHKARGTYPSNLTPKTPTFQVSREYRASANAIDPSDQLAAEHKRWLDASLDIQIASKRREVDWFEAQVTPVSLHAHMKPILASRTTELTQLFQMPKRMINSATGQAEERWVPSPAVIAEGNAVAEDLLLYALRVVSIAETPTLRAKIAEKAKKELRGEVDAEMADAAAPDNRNIDKIVAQAVSAALKKRDDKKKTAQAPKAKKGKEKKKTNAQKRAADQAERVARLPQPRGKKPPRQPKLGSDPPKQQRGPTKKGKSKAK